jgi:drug/metabolite transporter (DMT)-like permease
VLMAFALAAAALYGSADFLGGAASRRARSASVLVISAPVGVVVMLAAALLVGGPFQVTGMGWALAAGAVGGAGLIIFYAGLAAGPMSVVAPVSALVSTALPVGVALAMGERAGAAVYAGAVLCLVAIVLVSMEGMPPARLVMQVRPARLVRTARQATRRVLAWLATPAAGGPAHPARPPRQDGGPGQARRHAAVRGLGYGTVSGLSFGMFFLLIRNAGASSVLWPVFEARVAGTVIILGAAVWLGTRPPGPGAGRWVRPAAAAAGVMDATANACYLLAARAGLFGIAIVIISLYPGLTVLLARVMLGERMKMVQRVGLVLAAAGVALVTF